MNEQDEVNSQGSQEPRVLPETLNIEEIIETAQSIYIPSERLKALFEKHKLREPAPKPRRSPKARDIIQKKTDTFIAGATIAITADDNMKKREEANLENEQQDLIFAGTQRVPDDGDGVVSSAADFDARSKTVRRSQVRPNDRESLDIIQKINLYDGNQENKLNEASMRGPLKVQFEADLDEGTPSKVDMLTESKGTAQE